MSNKPLRYVALFDAEPTLAQALSTRFPSTLPRLRGMRPGTATRWVVDVATPLHELRWVRTELTDVRDAWDCAACDVAVVVVREPLFVALWRTKLTLLRAAGVAVALVVVVHDEDDGDDTTEHVVRQMLVDLAADGDDTTVFHVDGARLAQPAVVERLAAHLDEALRAPFRSRAPGVELVAAQQSVRTWSGIGRLRDLSPPDLDRDVVARLPCVHDGVPVTVHWEWLDAAQPVEGRVTITAPPPHPTPGVASRRIELGTPDRVADRGASSSVRVTLRPALGLGAPTRAFEGARGVTNVTLSPGGLSLARPVRLRGDVMLLDVVGAQVGDVVAFCSSVRPAPIVAGIVVDVAPVGVDVHRAVPPGWMQGGCYDDLTLERRVAEPR
jgi:hypothetical protein